MIVTNARNVDGNWDFDLSLQKEEVNFLMNFAVQTLMKEGLLTILEEEGEQKIDLLEHLQEEEMFQA